MLENLLTELPSLGISGLLFVMWWLERQERGRVATGLNTTLEFTGQLGELNRQLLEVIRGNTEAVTALREELRAHRASEAELLGRMMQQLDELAA
jgi:hypothetical protein